MNIFQYGYHTFHYSIRTRGSISIGMPTVGTRSRAISRDGAVGSSEVRDLGIEMATNEKALFFILPDDVNSDPTPNNGLNFGR